MTDEGTIRSENVCRVRDVGKLMGCFIKQIYRCTLILACAGFMNGGSWSDNGSKILVASKGTAKSGYREKSSSIYNKKSPWKQHVLANEAVEKGIFDSMRLNINNICIKEIPFFLALYKCFYQDERLFQGKTLVVEESSIFWLLNKAVTVYKMRELHNSDAYKIDSLCLYKEKKNRRNRNLCNFTVYVAPGAYEIPKTGASVIVPEIIKGSIYYKQDKMLVYIHTGGIKLELPKYAKALSLGLVGDMDIGFAEFEKERGKWLARLLYVKSSNNPQKKGWSFNAADCNKIRPYSD